ncbi:MAG: hypothetical protein B7Y90_01175 [Alphaproteobacteria bacterium 32-64-14]|nr:MAG: hypothetical protein B7Y90_01175 [Alphaproteobacteria bacterium 32-64-14]
MGMSRIAAMLVAAACLVPVVMAPAAFAQDGDLRKCANTEFGARSEALGEFGPFAGASFKAEPYHSVKGPKCRVITFYRVPAQIPGATTPAQFRKLAKDYAGKSAPSFFAARYVDDSKAASYQQRWTDQTRCPALVSALEKLEPVLAPKLTGDGPYRDIVSGSDELPVIRFWMTTQVYPQTDPNYTQNYSLDGGNGSAFGVWLDETFKALETCWSADKPVAP